MDLGLALIIALLVCLVVCDITALTWGADSRKLDPNRAGVTG